METSIRLDKVSILAHSSLGYLGFEHPKTGRQLAAGTVDIGETAVEAAARELFEETGVYSAPGRVSGMVVEQAPDGEGWLLRTVSAGLRRGVPVAWDGTYATRTDTGERAHVEPTWVTTSITRRFVSVTVDPRAVLPAEVVADGHTLRPRWIAPYDLPVQQRLWLRFQPGPESFSPRFARLEDGRVGLRAMRDDDSDYGWMSRWLNNARVLKWYGGESHRRSLDGARDEFRPMVRGDDPSHPVILEVDGSAAGFVQYYEVSDLTAYGLSDQVRPTFGCDLFIGEPDLWGQGFGTTALGLLVQYLFEDLAAARVVIDPHTTNMRAIAAYRNVGFEPQFVLSEHERHDDELRDCLIMAIARPG